MLLGFYILVFPLLLRLSIMSLESLYYLEISSYNEF